MTLPRALLFNVAFYGWTVLMHLLCLPLLALPRRHVVAAGHVWTKVGLWFLATICGLRHRVQGLDRLPDGPCILACKHQSAWETLVLSQVIGDIGYVVKRELAMIPLFGAYLTKAGVVPVDREGGTKALMDMVEGVRRCLAAGRSVAIYPEGTRTSPGERRSYHPGVAALYLKLDAPVVPVALNSGWFWGRRSFRKRPGTIDLVFLPPIEPGLSRRAFLAELEERIETACAALPRGKSD